MIRKEISIDCSKGRSMAVSDVSPAYAGSIPLQEALATIRRTIPKMADERPLIGRPDLTYRRCGADDWVEGFWSGQLWLAFAATGDPVYFQAARRQRPYFVGRLARPESHNHDLGFLYTLSAVADAKLSGDADARQMGLTAAAALARRYNRAGRFIQAWNPPRDDPAAARTRLQGRMIVDCMENLALLFWAAEETGDATFREVATGHAVTSARLLVRDDGSTFHAYDHDPVSGDPLGGVTVQGAADGSCWSRGQAWGIHGFAVAAAYTGAPLFRDTACRLADFAVANLPPDGVPYWDYRLPPDAPRVRDSSAAAITAAGLFLLADTLGGPPDRVARYRRTAHAILAGLQAGYTTVDAPHAEGLLRHGASDVPRGIGDHLLPYGDYFFLEATLRGLGHRDFFW
jgi:unsaturated chondroitin disaccharide hydrolase